MKNREVYLDAAANTYLDKRVYNAMKPYLNEKYMGNSFAIHTYGNRAMKAVEEARAAAANVLKVNSAQIIFTSGASEGNNTVIKAVALDILKHKSKKGILCSALEHSSVYNTCKQVESWGVSVEYLSPNKNGVFPQYVLRQKINKNIALVCMMAVNNETGIANDVNYILEKAHKVKSLVLTDCTQSIEYGKGSINIGGIRHLHADAQTRCKLGIIHDRVQGRFITVSGYGPGRNIDVIKIWVLQSNQRGAPIVLLRIRNLNSRIERRAA